MRKFTQLNGVRAKVLVEHCLFDKQVFICDELQVVNDDERIGVMIKGQAVFMYKQNVKVAEMQGDLYTISDGRLTIFVNKL
jgi:RNA binding exosome subunit